MNTEIGCNYCDQPARHIFITARYASYWGDSLLWNSFWVDTKKAPTPPENPIAGACHKHYAKARKEFQ